MELIVSFPGRKFLELGKTREREFGSFLAGTLICELNHLSQADPVSFFFNERGCISAGADFETCFFFRDWIKMGVFAGEELVVLAVNKHGNGQRVKRPQTDNDERLVLKSVSIVRREKKISFAKCSCQTVTKRPINTIEKKNKRFITLKEKKKKLNPKNNGQIC